MAEVARRVCRAIPGTAVVVDADTGHGNPLNTIRTVELYEEAGAAGIFLEDQVWPKKCGHMAGKRVVAAEEWLAKLQAAVEHRDKLFVVARTDARAAVDLDEAVARARAAAELAVTGRFSALRPLRHRNFALLWSAALVSNAGTWMQTIAVGTLVTQLTGRASGAGTVAAAAFLPIGILSPIGGAVADRVDRRRFLLLTTVGETLFATLLAVDYATGHANELTVSALVFGGGCMAALGFPSYQAMLPDLVGKDDLLGAVSLSSAQFTLGRVVGPV